MYKSQMYGHSAGQPVSSLYTTSTTVHSDTDTYVSMQHPLQFNVENYGGWSVPKFKRYQIFKATLQVFGGSISPLETKVNFTLQKLQG